MATATKSKAKSNRINQMDRHTLAITTSGQIEGMRRQLDYLELYVRGAKQFTDPSLTEFIKEVEGRARILQEDLIRLELDLCNNFPETHISSQERYFGKN